MSQMHRNVAVMVFAVGATSVACADVHSFPLPTHNFPAAASSVVATGGRIRFNGSCVYLEDEIGAALGNLLWPSGFTATAPPLTIYSPAGTPIIHEGDEVLLGVAETQPRLIPGCPTRGVWLVGEVGPVNGEWPEGPPLPPPRIPPGRGPR